MKFIDLSGNQISKNGLKIILKLGIVKNQTVVGIDVRLNEGITPKIKNQLAVCMLKNIEIMKAKGFSIKKEWLVPELYSFQIPPAILKGLGFKDPMDPKCPLKSRRKQAKRTLSLGNKINLAN